MGVWLTGHSMGAAVATVGMFHLANRGFSVQQSYVFESPRVGNSAWGRHFAERVQSPVPLFRITHKYDPVVHVPPQSVGYAHVGAEVYYEPSWSSQPLRHVICEGSEDKSCSNRYSDTDISNWNFNDHCASPLSPGNVFCQPSSSVCSASRSINTESS